MNTRTFRQGLYTVILALGLVGGSSGCDLIDKLKGKKDDTASKDKSKDKDKDSEDEDATEDDDGPKKKSASAEPSASAAPSASASASAEPSAEPSASASAEVPDEDEVVRYPDEQPQTGSYYTKKGFSVYKAADNKSKELGKITTGTLITLEASRGGSWLLVKWPSGVGELSLGWLEVPQRTTTIQETQDKPDATLRPPPVPSDAGPTTVPDAGHVVPTTRPDAGRPRIPPVTTRPHK